MLYLQGTLGSIFVLPSCWTRPRPQGKSRKAMDQPCTPYQTPHTSACSCVEKIHRPHRRPPKSFKGCIAQSSAATIRSSPKNSHRHPILLSQVPNHQPILLPHPTIPRPTTIHIISGETAICIASPEIQRSAQLNTIVESVHKGLGQSRSASGTGYWRVQAAVEGESQVRGVVAAAFAGFVSFRVG
jgi:hypothetical protein